MRTGRIASLWILGLVACLGLGLALPSPATAALERVKVLIMGEPLRLQPGDPAPYVQDEVLMVPARPTLEAFDATVLWDAQDQSITAVTDAHRITVWLGRLDARTDGRATKLEMAPTIVQGRAMIPLRFVVDSFEAALDWSEEAWVYLPNDPAPVTGVTVSVLVGGPSPHTLSAVVQEAGATMVSLGPLVRAMGGVSTWDPTRQVETARVGRARLTVFRGQRLSLRADMPTAPEQEVDLGANPRLGDGTLLVPLGPVVSALGGSVKLLDGELVVAPTLSLQVNGERLPPPVISGHGVVMAETRAVLTALGRAYRTDDATMMPLQRLVALAGGSMVWVGNEAVVVSPITIAVDLDSAQSVIAVPAELGEHAAVMVPADLLADALHLGYAASSTDRSVTLQSGGRSVTFYGDQPTASRSTGRSWSASEEFEASAQAVWGETQVMVPLQDLVESLGFGYRWDSHTARATIVLEATPPFAGWPAKGITTVESDDLFGMRIHPVYRSRRFHDGMDLPLFEGTPIAAVAPGEVILAQSDGDYGLTVQINHGSGVVTQYSHLSRIPVRVGQRVGAGECVGYAGNTGLSTGPHLHFMVTVNGEAVDPQSWLP